MKMIATMLVRGNLPFCYFESIIAQQTIFARFEKNELFRPTSRWMYKRQSYGGARRIFFGDYGRAWQVFPSEKLILRFQEKAWFNAK